MRTLGVLAGAALIAMAGAAAAQGFPWLPPPAEAPAEAFVPPPWMQDDGSSSDYPTHTATDWEADGLNYVYRGGLTIPQGPPPGIY